MKYRKLITKFCIAITLLGSCKPTRDNYYSYEINTYTQPEKTLLLFDRVISYGDYLFEFDLKENVGIEHFEGSSKTISSSTIDTTCVYLLSKSKKMYYRFDTFSLNNKMTETGALSSRKTGHRVFRTTKRNLFYTLPPVDTIINNIECYYSFAKSTNEDFIDTVSRKVILIKNKKFNSLQKVQGADFSDPNYCIIGYSIYHYKLKGGFYDQISNLKPLTQKEKDICESMVKKAESNY